MAENPLVAAPLAEPPAPGAALPTPTPEQQHNADRLFARDEERHGALDLLGMVAAAQLLHDVATDHFHNAEAEADDEASKKKRPDEPQV